MRVTGHREAADLHGLLLDLVRSIGLLHGAEPRLHGPSGSHTSGGADRSGGSHPSGGSHTSGRTGRSEGQVSVSELFALHELDASGGLAQHELADLLRLEKSTVSRLVAGLEHRGLLVRERDPGNRRFVRLSLTPAGQRLHLDLARAMHDRQRSVLGSLTPSERSALETGLTALLRVLHHSVHDPAEQRAGQ